jgi:probable F420-dependent oxidoreductase
MHIVTTIPQHDLTTVPDAARAAEAAGYDGLMTLENRHDPFLPLGVAATATTRVTLLTGLAIAFPRSPMVVANLGWDLQAASRGRFVLGLGSQVRGHIERRFSVPWSPPAPRMREYISALRAIWRSWKTGEQLSFDGAHYKFSLMTPQFVPEPMAASAPAITIGAVGPVMLRLAGELCDGVRLHPFCTRKYLEDVVQPNLEAGLERANRPRSRFEISGGGFIATGADQAAVDKMLRWVRQRVAFYGATRAYWPVLECHGLIELGHQLYDMAKNGRWSEMPDAVPENVLELFAAAGTHSEIVEKIRVRFGGFSDTILASLAYDMPPDLTPEVIAGIKRIPTAFMGYGEAAR